MLGVMASRAIAWAVRVAAFVLVGVLTFIVQPPGATAVTAQLIGYSFAGLGLLAWALLDWYPKTARYRPRALPVVFVVIALAAGLASTAGANENTCVVTLASMAATGAGVQSSRAVGWVVTLAGVFGLDVNWIIYRQGTSQLSNFLLLPTVPLAGLLLGRLLLGRRVQAEQSAALLAQTQELLAEQGRADVLGERARIAREIHDVLAHSLGALSIQIQSARAVLTDHRDIDRAVDILATAQRMASDGLTETRRAVHALRMDSKPLNEELSRVTGIYGDRYDVKVTLDIGGDPRPVPPDATVALLRTAQEALVNAVKHATGQRVSVHLDYRPDRVRLTVVNDLSVASGHDPATPAAGSVGSGSVTGGYGLTGMRERLRLLNGTLVAGPRTGQWAVTAEIPLTPASHPPPETP
jgi:signal transduction histidine kinase